MRWRSSASLPPYFRYAFRTALDSRMPWSVRFRHKFRQKQRLQRKFGAGCIGMCFPWRVVSWPWHALMRRASFACLLQLLQFRQKFGHKLCTSSALLHPRLSRKMDRMSTTIYIYVYVCMYVCMYSRIARRDTSCRYLYVSYVSF